MLLQRVRSCTTIAATLATIVLAACGGGGDNGGTTGPPPVIPTVAFVEVSPTTASVVAPQTVQLSFVARLTNGSTNVPFGVVWTSSANTIATVSGTGVVTGVSAGTAVITATVGGVSGSATITVTAAPGSLASMAVAIIDATIELAQTTQATASGRDPSGAPVALGTRPVTWTSSSTTVATVSASGVVTGVGIGTANITASVTDNGVVRSGSTTVTVTGIANAPATIDIFMPGLTFSPFQATVKQGGTVNFIFPSLAHNVIWDPRLAGQPAAPADINTVVSVTVSRSFPSVGVFPYKCTLHPGMDGIIVVSP